jgi:hypothetical protein
VARPQLHQIDIQKNNLQLHYFLPQRNVTISKELIHDLVFQEEWHKTKNYRLTIKTKDGKEFTSSLVGPELFKKNIKELKQRLIIKQKNI